MEIFGISVSALVGVSVLSVMLGNELSSLIEETGSVATTGSISSVLLADAGETTSVTAVLTGEASCLGSVSETSGSSE